MDLVIRLYSEGAWDDEICKELKVSYKEFEKRYDEDPMFAELVDYGRMSAKAWWLKLLREGAKGSKANFNFAYAVMKNRFGWSDKSEVQMGTKPIEQMDKSALEAEIASKKDILERLLKSSRKTLAEVASDEAV